MDGMGEFVSVGEGAFVAVNDENAYDEPWEVSEIAEYVHVPENVGTPSPGGESRFGPDLIMESYPTGGKTFTTIARGNGTATVRANVAISYGFNIPTQDRVSGTVSAGDTFTSRDRNNNGVPDLLEKGVRSGAVRTRN